MSDDEYNDEYDEYGNSGGSLRKQLEKTLAELKKSKDETASLKSQIAQSKASEALTAKGYPPAVARLAIKDGVDLGDEKALDNWLTENGDLFVKPEPQQDSGQEQNEQQQVDEIPEGVESAFRNVNRIHAAASPAEVNRFKAALDAIPKNATKEEVREALAGF